MGPFAITQLDARRLRLGLAELATRDPERGQRVRARAQASIGGLADDEPCPALDPETGLCDLYAARPITCRTFGPPARCESGDLAVCELCFQGATEAEIAACEVEIDPDDLEPALLEQLEQETGARGETTVAEALGAC
jgi:Fe-S-cluster containining protein